MWRLCLLYCASLVAVEAGRDFPPGFMFGAASASYQVEGAWNYSDKSESVWDHLTHNHPEAILKGANGDVACDSFHQWQTDVNLAAELGLHFYRFSISWPRLLPTGFPNKISEDGSRYYNNLIDGLLARGIQPVVTMYHWDLPQRLQDLDKSESVWDHLTHNHPEAILKGANGDVACDSFHQWQTDVNLAAELGLHFYRFSISWPRLLPTGFPNKISEDGSRYYNNLIDGLLARGIQPVVTMYHWDLPQRLQDLGGWTNPLMADWFADYARVLYSLYGDRVKFWLTINEPIVVCDGTYASGAMAPPVHDSDVGTHMCTKNLLMAHAKAYHVYDDEFRHKYNGKISMANQAVWYQAASESAEDVEVAELAMQLQVGRYSQAIFGEGGWPASVERLVEKNSKEDGYPRSRLPSFTQDEIEYIKGTFDYYGLNHYTSREVAAAPRTSWSAQASWPMHEWAELPATFHSPAEWPSNGMWLQVYPTGFRKLLSWLKDHYGDIPILITENGYGSVDSGLDDVERVEYYQLYMDAILKSIQEDHVNVIGYTAWTLLDNFEWSQGYDTRFGLYEVNFTDPLRKRTARRSARYYASVIKHHSLDVPEEGL